MDEGELELLADPDTEALVLTLTATEGEEDALDETV